MSDNNGTPITEYVLVTPDMANEWLGNQSRNRAVSQKRVSLYAAMMKRGAWYLTNAGLAFDEYGQLIDGQHRLLAVVNSQTPTKMLVVRELPHKAQIVLDQPLIRRGHDQIAIKEGWEVRPIHLAVAKQMIYSISAGGKAVNDMTTDVLLMDEFYRRYHRAIEFAVKEFFQFTPVKGITMAPVVAPVARAWYTQDRERLCRFARVLGSGLADQKGDGPAAVLRNWLLRGTTQVRAKSERRLIYNKTEVALDAFLKGRTIQRLGQVSIDRELFALPDENIRVVKAGRAIRKDTDKSGCIPTTR